MFGKIIVILFYYIAQTQSLVKLPKEENNNISVTEAITREIVNELFSSFRIKDFQHRPKLKQFITIHNFFASITLTDSDNLNEIARLTRVGNIDNNSQHFIAQINEADKNDEVDNKDVYVTQYITEFINKLKRLKEKFANKSANEGILRYFNRSHYVPSTLKDNITSILNENINKDLLSDDEFWERSGRRIDHGIRTRIKDFPFMASVQFFRKFQCAGSIIKSDLVITAASCLQLAWNNRFFRETPSFLSVQVGSDFYEYGGENIPVLEIYFHPSYDPKTLRNNLAIMRLMRKISFRKKHDRVKKIKIDTSDRPLPPNVGRITVVGWGAKDSSNIIYNMYKNKLSYSELDYYSLSDCRDHYSKQYVTKKNFCAGFYSQGGGACNRDAGGPGIVGNILMGVISFGSPVCGAPDSPTVFTKLGFYTDWIEEIMEQDVPHFGKRTTTTTWTPFTYWSYETTTEIRLVPVVKTTTPHYVPVLDFPRLKQDQREDLEISDTSDSKDTESDEYESKIRREPKYPEIDSRTKLGSPVRATTELRQLIQTDEDTNTTNDGDGSFETDLDKLVKNLAMENILKQAQTSKIKAKATSKRISTTKNDVYNINKHLKQVVFHFPTLSEEIKDVKDDSIHRDLTFRGDHNKTMQDIMSEAALVDMIAQAIEEKRKKMKKNTNKRHYLL